MVESKDIQSCVSKKVSYIAHEKYGGSIPPDKRKQVLAIAYSYCRNSRKAKSDFFNSIFEKCLVNDFYVEDGMDELIAWVLKKGLTKDPEEAKDIAFAISKARKKKGKSKKKKSQKSLKELEVIHREVNKRMKERGIPTGRHSERDKIRKEVEREEKWKETWAEIAEDYEKQRKARQRLKEMRKGEKNQLQKSIYGVVDGEIVAIKNDADLPFGITPKPSFNYKTSKEIGGYDWKALREIVGMEGPTLSTPAGTNIIGTRMLTNQPMTPIGSSTVKGAGVFNNDLLVQFHDTSGTYRYHFDTPEEARQSFEDLVNARSAGEFIWQQFRGHKKGEKVTPEKIGPAYFSGKPTIGGTTASLVEYDIAGRTPQIKMPDYERLAEEMRKYKTMVKKPPESAEEFTPEELIASQRLKILQMLQEEFKKMGIATDFQEPEYVLSGTISRGGKFYYPQGWEKKNYYQLKDIYQEFGHIPAYSAMNYEGHNENELIGFGYDWEFIDPNEEFPDGFVDSKIYVFPDVIQKYNLSEDKLFDIPVSVSQYDDADHRFTDTQNITDLYHIAVSLDKTLQDRCSLKGGHPCRVSIISDGTAINNKSAIDSIPNRKDGASGIKPSYPQIKRKEDKPMPDEINVDEILKQLLQDVEKLKKDGEKRNDSLDTKTGADSTAFQRIGDKEGFMKGCRDAGLSESKCNEAWNARNAKGTGADKGGLEEGKDSDKHTYDFAQIEELISKKIEDGISAALTKKDETQEIEEIKTYLKEKFGKEKCDFVDNLSLVELRAAKRTYELTHPETTNDREDMVSNAELFGPKQIQDFETRQRERSADRLKTKWGWVGAL